MRLELLGKVLRVQTEGDWVAYYDHLVLPLREAQPEVQTNTRGRSRVQSDPSTTSHFQSKASEKER